MTKTFIYPRAVVDVPADYPRQRWVEGNFGSSDNSASISVDPANPLVILWTKHWRGKVTLTADNMRSLATVLLQGADALDEAVATAKEAA